MTLPLACPPSSSSTSSDPRTGPQRKRRRRAPASGASDDCFACVKRNTKCDRRRPYCSACLEIGKECSGYKTQLTWGVGVASRGKLRGLSLPVARSAPAQRSPPPSHRRPRASSTISRDGDGDDEGIKIKTEGLPPIPTNASYTNYDFVNMAPHGVQTPMQMPEHWNMEMPMDDFPPPPQQAHDGMSQQRQLPQLHRLHTLSIGRADGLSLASSVDSISTYAESDYASPISQTFPSEDGSFMHSPIPMYSSYPSRHAPTDGPAPGLLPDSRGPTSCPDQYYAQSEMSSSISSHQNLYDISEARQHQSSPAGNEMFYDDDILGPRNVKRMDGYSQRNNMDEFSTSTRSTHFGWMSVNNNDEDMASQASDLEAYRNPHDSLPSVFPEMSPRVSFFLDYYEKIICPSVVVIDSSNNPYREHILQLASKSKSLQHAICALSACNLRMKRKQSLGFERWRLAQEFESQDRVSATAVSPIPTRRISDHLPAPESSTNDSSLEEEYSHRSRAVFLLNQQLSDPSQARHDSVLATLFILCHYRMCESGVANFRVTFQGVKKLLGMRKIGSESLSWGWMESLFTYFDGIAASINDREAQLRGGFLDMIANPSEPKQALENLTGCDSQLFRVIGKLGRLNLLSQHRPVHSDSYPAEQSQRETPPRPRPGLSGQALVDFYNRHAHNFDGNGFTSTLDDEPTFAPSHDDLRTTFWLEWKAARQALQEWKFDSERLMINLPVTPSPMQLRDFSYISEAFRYAALLYTERLACPALPSSHLNFQNLVSQVLYYVTSLEQESGCEKFLLWPLFLAGSECINELQQSIVRTKCREIMGRSGYLNNLAGLEVLEKLWQEKVEGVEGGSSFGGPFAWTRHMNGESEWIMV